MAKHAAGDPTPPIEQPTPAPAYFTPYGPPPPPQIPHYQYSSPYGYSPTPAYYQPPLYLQPNPQWPQQPFSYYPPPQVWGQDHDGKRQLHLQHVPHPHHQHQQLAQHPQMHQNHHPQQSHHVQHLMQQQHQMHHQQQHFSYAARQQQQPSQNASQHSYAYAVAGPRDLTQQEHSSPSQGRIPTSPHTKRPGGRRRSSTPVQSSSSMPNGVSTSNSAASTPSKPRPPARSAQMKSDSEDTEEAIRILNTQAMQAVASADEVTLALSLTSWASYLDDSQKHVNSSGAFQHVFDASNALQIVSESILFMEISPNSAVQKALISLYGFVLYGDEEMHRKLADEARTLRDALKSISNEVPEDPAMDRLAKRLENNTNVDPTFVPSHRPASSLTAKQAAVHKVLLVLRSIANDVNAYNGILPLAFSDKNRGPIQGSVGATNGSPAGPDPTKVVERSMDEWRRACARLQGEMAIVVVLEEALTSVDEQLAAPHGSSDQLVQFFRGVSEIVKSRLHLDIEQRRKTLRETWWSSVATGDATAVFEAVDARSCEWRGLFQDSLSELEAQLNDMGLGFGPAARVSLPKVPSLVSASAGVAALVSTHRQALDWCQETSELLTVMTVAFRALADRHGGSYRPPKQLVTSFLEGVNRASSAIIEVQDWSFDPVHTKILGSLQKSASNLGTNGSRQKGIRFEEPDKSDLVRQSSTDSNQEDGKAGDSGPGQQRRRKPRHARMKSSPDELLHLNAHLEVPRQGGDLQDAHDSVGDTSLDKFDDQDSSTNGEELSLIKEKGGNNGGQHYSSPRLGSLATSSATNCENTTSNSLLPDGNQGHRRGSSVQEGELAVVYEGKLLEYEGDDEDDDDRHIIVNEDVEESNGPKKVSHSSHVRSMSVDGIPFGV